MSSLRTRVLSALLITVVVGPGAARSKSSYVSVTDRLAGGKAGSCQALKRQAVGEEISSFWKRP